MLFLSATDVELCRIPMRDVIGLVELALAEHGHGRTEMPAKLGVHPRAGALLHAMPAWVAAAGAAGMKWVAAYPDNAARGWPAVTGIILLNDPETGLPEAILDGAWITAMRTAASTAVAARKLAPPDAETLAIIGPGVQGRSNVAALCEVLPNLKKVRAYAPKRETVERFAQDIECGTGLRVEPAASVVEALDGAQAAVAAAPWPPRAGQSAAPSGTFDALPFTCALDLDSTVPAQAVEAADRFFADDVATFESHRQRGVFREWPNPLELSKVVAGTLPGRQHAQERIVCANLGLGIYDVVVARHVLEIAARQGIGTLLA
ncbi:MAG: ornithine cyclodeaminase family protein [Acidobacteria bacterium]|nr:ornithine cyclodeaminase family protein [Acidobacteriota bacterium]